MPAPTKTSTMSATSAKRRAGASVLGLPAPRRLAGRVVQVHDDLPDLLLVEPVLPRRHHRVPRRGLLGQPGPALGDAPEEIGLLEHRDRARVLEVRWRRVEPVREVPLAVQVVAVTVHAVADIDLAPCGDVLLEISLVLPQRVVEALDRELLAPELDWHPRRRG